MPVDPQRSQHLFERLARTIRRVSAHPLPEHVHEFRTTVRRIETLLDTLDIDAGRDQRKLFKRLSRLRRRAGKVRDLDVQMAALRTLKIGSDAARKAQLMRELVQERSRRERRLLESFDADTLRSLRKRLARVSEQLPTVTAAMAGRSPNGRKPSSFDPVELALRRFVQVAREQGAPSEATLHEYRMACKRIRYVAEMAGDDARAKQAITHLKAIQDAVGAWHDWDVLTRRAEEMFEAVEAPPIVSALRNVTGAKLSEALRISAEAKQALLSMARQEARPRAAKPIRRVPGSQPAHSQAIA